MQPNCTTWILLQYCTQDTIRLLDKEMRHAFTDTQWWVYTHTHTFTFAPFDVCKGNFYFGKFQIGVFNIVIIYITKSQSPTHHWRENRVPPMVCIPLFENHIFNTYLEDRSTLGRRLLLFLFLASAPSLSAKQNRYQSKTKHKYAKYMKINRYWFLLVFWLKWLSKWMEI